MLDDKYQIELHEMQLWRARNKAAEWNEGTHAKSFRMLNKYSEALSRYDKNAVMLFKFEEMDEHEVEAIRFVRQPVFKRFFVCFDAMRKGFVEGCRAFIGLNSCHLKRPFKRLLLPTVSVDGNKGNFLLAFAAVEGEDKDS